jgi:hypothetical protein
MPWQYLRPWRAVTSNLLRDAFSAAGVTVAAPKHPWGIAILTMNRSNGSSCEPLLCDAEDTVDGRAKAAVYGGLRLLNFEEAVANYAACLRRLAGEELQRELVYKPVRFQGIDGEAGSGPAAGRPCGRRHQEGNIFVDKNSALRDTKPGDRSGVPPE